MSPLRSTLRQLYFGSSPRAQQFRLGLLVFDITTIAFFVYVAATGHQNDGWIRPIELLVGLLIALDFLARLIAEGNPLRYLMRLTTWADLAVVVTIFLPLLVENLVFLRVLRALRLVSSYRILRDLEGRSRFVQRNSEVIESLINLSVFVFVTTELVYVMQHQKNPAIASFIDALYFTVATLTTTGFGDITLIGEDGRLLAVLIMIFGVALFLRLVQTVFRPAKVAYTCPSCGLTRHDPDAIHCKHCGRVIHIETEGE